MLRNLSEELQRLETLIQGHIDQHPELKKDFDLLTSIKSVGFQLGLNMLVILRSHRFDTAGQAAAFLGVVPVEKSSGTSVRGQSRLSKIGPPEIRARLYLMTTELIDHLQVWLLVMNGAFPARFITDRPGLTILMVPSVTGDF